MAVTMTYDERILTYEIRETVMYNNRRIITSSSFDPMVDEIDICSLSFDEQEDAEQFLRDTFDPDVPDYYRVVFVERRETILNP